ncbi:MAG: hypothetical protein ACRD2C_03070, partial [Acidimicrobiales bacterium]
MGCPAGPLAEAIVVPPARRRVRVRGTHQGYRRRAPAFGLERRSRDSLAPRLRAPPVGCRPRLPLTGRG